MFALVAVMCHGCLADYYSPTTQERPTITLDGQRCPGGTVEEATAVEREVICVAPDGRGVRFNFDDAGKVEVYVTLKAGARDGTSQRWEPATGKLVEDAQWRGDRLHGTRRLYDASGKVTLEERWRDGERDGDFRKARDGVELERGRYARGERVGIWSETQPDGVVAEGAYQNGKRVGIWRLGDASQITPDYVVDFANGTTAPTAERTSLRYEKPMFVLDGALLALAFYGQYTDRKAFTAAGYIGLATLPPVVHAVMQPSETRRRVVGESLGVRPGIVASVLFLYTVGKFFDAFECHHTDDVETGEGSSCGNVTYDFDGDYSLDGILVASGLLIAAADIAMAHRREHVAVERAWPQLSVTPLAEGGASLQLAGRW